MNGNILIVDDEAASLKLLNDILTAEGHRVRPFNNGELALRSALVETPELFLFDIRMPVMNGFELCRRIKEYERLQQLPVIFISAASEVEDKVKAFQAGGVDYITKPYHKEEVIARVDTHLALSRAREEMRQMNDALRVSEQSLKIAQSIAHLGHWEWDVSTGEFLWSEETYRILGYKPQVFPASYDAFLQTVHHDDRERVAREINKAREGIGFDIEYKIILPNGTVRVVHGKAEFIRIGPASRPRIFGTIQDVGGARQTTMLGVIQDITEQKELEWQLEEQANTDALTGCASRRNFFEHAAEEILRVHRYGGEMSMLMLDLDYFKAVNDKYGHAMGDITLKKLVEASRSVLREVDMLGRIGGEEFAVLLPETGSERALEVAERLRQAIADTEVPLKEGALHFTASIGVATLAKNDASTEMLLKRADQALYKAKKSGRNRVCAAT
ncbi:MAG TPA: diguanylate cyclase [Gallionellaceae bacterium]